MSHLDEIEEELAYRKRRAEREERTRYRSTEELEQEASKLRKEKEEKEKEIQRQLEESRSSCKTMEYDDSFWDEGTEFKNFNGGHG